MKTLRLGIAGGVAAVLLCALCIWKPVTVQLTHPVAKGYHLDLPAREGALQPRVSALDANMSHRDEKGSLPDSTHRLSAADEALRWLEHELRRAARIADENERKTVLRDVCLYWAGFDPADALNMAHELGFDQGSDGVFEDILQKWTTKDFSAALSWVNHESVGESRDRLMARVAFVQSQTQPAAAAKLVVEQISPGPAQAEAGISVLHQWALRDFVGAAGWADSFPSGDLKDRARAELLGIMHYRTALSQTAK